VKKKRVLKIVHSKQLQLAACNRNPLTENLSQCLE
jgi:hypothetical protein